MGTLGKRWAKTDRRVIIRLSAEEYTALKERAEHAGATMSDVMRQALKLQKPLMIGHLGDMGDMRSTAAGVYEGPQVSIGAGTFLISSCAGISVKDA